MTFGRTKKLAVIAAVCAALLVASVSAAVLWLSPGQVAREIDQPWLAEAFDSPDAIAVNETVESGDFAITLLGLVSGEDLHLLRQNLGRERTYIVLALRRLDGTPLDNQFDSIRYSMTLLVSGYSPTAVNSWTLHDFGQKLARDGVYYFIQETANVEVFADRPVYVAFYEGSAPDNSTFTVADDGSIAFAEDFEGVQALFTLPLDPSKADPAAADAIVGPLTGWSNERTHAGEDAGAGEEILQPVS